MDIFNCINSSLQRLAHIRRYAAIPVHRVENVAEHSFYCILYASLIARDLISEGHKINHELVIMKAMHHDMEEAETGDIIRSFKYTTPELRAEIARAGEMRMLDLTHQMGDASEETYNIWKEAKDDSPEGQIVHLADQLCLISYVREELLKGNRYMEPVAQRAHDFIRKAATGELDRYYHQVYPTGDWRDILRQAQGEDA